ncbi:methionyl-tRNA formyltransferase [Companilactobacillus sp. RD055328]|uniref:methionyl-tRNA formyltransferase n=1 Tax=Companilactobacillus sp. RD055328 TaxID=2916634 RepID=UPI001FC830AB|nr:methionyl-tRNA formyltransferase [Companilactobacillus sp. RD055328]GKQ42563.1 methionyl-tRNA formyltransferase [Companilactobacillus sp. RD055328]
MTKIIFMGTPNLAATVFKGIIDDGNYEVIAAVTQPDKPVGRKKVLQPTPVKQVALDNDIPVYQPEKLSGSDEIKQLIELHADVLVTAAYGQFLPMSLIDSVGAAVNVHGSLLPKYRGGAPIQWSIMNGEEKTGITIMYMVKAMDAGDMIAKAEVKIEDDDTGDTMFDKLSIVGRDLLLKVLPDIVNGTNERTPQNQDEATISPNISKEQEQIDITDSAINIHNKVRALNSNPGAYAIINGLHTKIWRTEVISEENSLEPGTVIERTKKKLVIATGEFALAIKELQPSGKKSMDIASYLNGIGREIEVGQKIIE